MAATPARGLTSVEAAGRLASEGPHALRERVPDSLWSRFARQFESPLIYILLVALVIDLVIWTLEGATVIAVESIAIAYRDNEEPAPVARGSLPVAHATGRMHPPSAPWPRVEVA